MASSVFVLRNQSPAYLKALYDHLKDKDTKFATKVALYAGASKTSIVFRKALLRWREDSIGDPQGFKLAKLIGDR
jgi:hypothetical protein